MALGRGQPTLFTDERRKRILEAVAEGHYRVDAAELVGIHPTTLHGWLRKGRKEKAGEYFNFFIAIVNAESTVKTKCIKGVLDAGAQDSRNYQWYLERKFPEQWGRDRLHIKQLEERMVQLEAREAANRVAHRTHGSDRAKPNKKNRQSKET